MGLSAATALVAATGAVSSFAWFAANSTVTATGMTIKANASDAFLQITTSAKDWNEADSFNSAAAVTASQMITPVQVYNAIENKKGTTYTGGSPTWGAGYSNSVDSAAVNENGISAVTMGNSYALINDFKLRLRPAQNGSQATAKKLAISVSWASDPTANDNLYKSVSVLVTNNAISKGQLFTISGTGTWAATTQTDSINVVENLTNTEQIVKVYVFFNGDNENCMTKNVVTDHSYSVNLSFSIAE